MVPQASEKCGLLPPEHQQIGCCTSNILNSEQVPGTFSTLTISSLALQASAEIVIRFLTPFLATHRRSHRSLRRHQHKARKGS